MPERPLAKTLTADPDAARPVQYDRPETMLAVVVREGSGKTSLQPERMPVPTPGSDQVLVRVQATSVISSEIASREGVSTATLPLILGNDFVGTVVEAPGAPSMVGRLVVGAYGGYGYTRPGAWAEFIVVDQPDVFSVETELGVEALAAIPGSFTAASGALRSLGDLAGKRLLIRGGTSGVGLAAATLALDQGAHVISTTRDPSKVEKLLAHGVHDVVIDDDDFTAQVRRLFPLGVDLAVDLLGVDSLRETLRCVQEFGIVCITGLLRDQTKSIRSREREDRSIPLFPHPMDLIPPTVRLTVGGVDGTARTPDLMRQWVAGVQSGRYRIPVDSVFTLHQMEQAHRRRSDPAAFGKVIVTVGDDPRTTSSSSTSSTSTEVPQPELATEPGDSAHENQE
ncbi:zinc-binding dehydrogenase [Subtercola frigoramans]|uniref:NADPH:quinone reductase-like Zn-dependent oxidoreductase n=1 Tax=Subtercola frigoramans TaxID=120298 RepID=A0ABS2L1E3_9MICO|nr:NADPH:quinone reductase-like Zn-dependent oxidoreductase [Subtercola frigoramans]